VQRSLGFSSIDIRVSGRNLKTWTNYTGYDPERTSGARSPQAPGRRCGLLQQSADTLVRVLGHSQRTNPEEIDICVATPMSYSRVWGCSSGRRGVTASYGEQALQQPNLPTEASLPLLFVGVQAGQFAFQEGTVAMMMCEWVQACSAG